MKSLQKQFLGKTALTVFFGLTAVFILSAIFRESIFAPIILIALMIGTFYASYKQLAFGLFIAFAEMMAGGHGHLFTVSLVGFPLSLRMAIFGAVFFALLVQLFQKRLTFQIVPTRDYPFIAVFLAIVIGTLIGFIHHPIMRVFDDANSYFAFAYLLPVIAIQWNSLLKRQFLQVFFASALWTALLSIGLSFTFTHLPLSTSGDIYTFVRDARMAEITLQVPNEESSRLSQVFAKELLGDYPYWYRIFSPAQLYPLFFLLYLFIAFATYLKREKVKGEWYVIGAICLAAMILGASRSFLVGAFAGFMPVLMYLMISELQSLRDYGKLFGRSIIVFGLAGLIAWGSIVFPFPERPNIFDAAFYKTSAETERSVAIASRWALLTPMMDQIIEAPITGKGFGTTVTYKSEDPRIIAETGGIYETYRFEWGYQDIWLKMGILGLIAFIWLFINLMRFGWLSLQNHSQKPTALLILAGLIALFASHTFSPYLNHPIGIAFILFVLPFLDFKEKPSQKEQETKKERAGLRVPNPVLTSEMTD